uniref:Uncharacterized protein n=1 Tax=Brassica oleracea TaxID=3712 RepID=A0A3P6CZF4_BRAOL|nr:unnamed protein product [Brassica oleracea]
MDQEVFKRADLKAFFKALKESGNTLGNTFGYSYAAHTLPSTIDKLLDIFKSSYTTASNPRNTDKLLDMFKSAYTATSEPSITSKMLGLLGNLIKQNEPSRTEITRNMHKPLIIDSGASHHMISDNNLIKDI